MSEKSLLNNRIKSWKPSKIGPSIVTNTENLDGFKYLLEEGYWALIRFSGTEPLLRLHVEGKSHDHIEQILKEINSILFDKKTII